MMEKVFTVLVLVSYFVQTSTVESDLKNLVRFLFTDYDPGIRPTLHTNTTVNVNLQFGVIQLLNVEEVAKTIECVSFMELTWTDELLTWNPEQFGNVSRFRYPHDKVWKPDIILTNTPDLNNGPVMNQASTNVIINSDGTVTNSFTVVYKATCRTMDMSNFPFDHHTCFFDFASWTYSGSELDVHDVISADNLPNSMKLVFSSEWDIDMNGSLKIVETECCPNETYPTLRVNISLKRKPLYFLINIVIPTTITCYISFFGMFSPSTSSGERLEKAFLGITTLLAVSLLMLTVSAQMPVTSNAVPLMGFFLGVYIVTIAIAIICTSIIMHIDVQGNKGRPLPAWAKKYILEKLGKFIFIYDPPYTYEEVKQQEKDEELVAHDNNVSSDLQKSSNVNYELLINIEKLLANHCNEIFAKKQQLIAQRDQKRNLRLEWSQLCNVLDRCCLFFFLFFSTVFTVTVMSRNNV